MSKDEQLEQLAKELLELCPIEEALADYEKMTQEEKDEMELVFAEIEEYGWPEALWRTVARRHRPSA